MRSSVKNSIKMNSTNSIFLSAYTETNPRKYWLMVSYAYSHNDVREILYEYIFLQLKNFQVRKAFTY